MELDVKTLIVGFISVLFGLSFLLVSVGQVTEGVTIFAVSDERHGGITGGVSTNLTFFLNASKQFYPSNQGIDTITIVENTTTVFSRSTNGTGCTFPGQYLVDTVLDGNITACKYSTTGYINVTYTYKPANYVDDSLTRAILPIALLIIAGGLVFFAVRYFIGD